MTLANYPELVKMDRVPCEPAEPLERAKELGGAFTGVSWYSNYPDHYAGDARPATREKGLVLRDIAVEELAEFIAAVKADTVVPALNAEFFARERAQRSGAAGA